jgi:hypothetical protein
LAPGLASGLWLFVAGAVVLVTFAAISHDRIGSNQRSVLEFGLVMSAFLLVSPLVEPMYFVFLLAPWIALLLGIYRQGWPGALQRPVIWLAVILSGLWLLQVDLLVPAVRLALGDSAVTTLSRSGWLMTAQHLVVSVATFGLLFAVLRRRLAVGSDDAAVSNLFDRLAQTTRSAVYAFAHSARTLPSAESTPVTEDGWRRLL